MLGSIFHKRKKPQDLRTPALQDIKRFRDAYARHAERRGCEPPACLERSVYKAISSQRDLHSLDFRQEDIIDPQLIALAETLVELPLISSLDLRDNRITDDGAKALLEVLRLQIIAAKTPVTCDPTTKKPQFPQVPDYTKYVTSVNLRGNEVSAEVQQELAQYTAILRREDKRLEIRAALTQIDRDSGGDIDEDEFKGVLKLLTGTEPSKRDLRSMLQQHSLASDSAQGALSLENVLLARCSSPTSNKAASPPWEALVQVRHAVLGPNNPSVDSGTDLLAKKAMDLTYSEVSVPPSPVHMRMPSPVASVRSTERLELDIHDRGDSEISLSTPRQSSLNVQREETPSSTPEPTPTIRSAAVYGPPVVPPLVFAPPSPDMRRGGLNSARSSSVAPDDESSHSSARRSITKQASGGQSRGVLPGDRASTPSASSASSPRQSEPVEGPRSAVLNLPMASPAKQVAVDDGEKAVAVDKSAFAIRDADCFDQDDQGDFMNDLENHSEADIFGNDSSTDDLLLSALSMSSASDSRKGEATSSSSGHSSAAASQLETGLDSSRSFTQLEHGNSRDVTERRTSREEESASEEVNECDDNSNWLEDRAGCEDDAANDQVTGLVVDQGVTAVDDKVETSDDEEEERVNVVEAEVVKDGKPRTVMKLSHTGFKSGLKLAEFPSELPFRNLLVLILSNNKLRDLRLLDQCRFRSVLVLDLSRNRLTKVPDKALAMFPKLQVLDMAHNQLKSISGVLEPFKLRALNVSHNSLRSVTNIEHLVFLEVLSLSSNSITAAQSLRLLSLNKMLTRIDLEGNPVVTDERQRRKNIAYILNLVPTLTSLGSIPCASLQSKEKKKKAVVAATDGVSLFDASYFPEMGTAWVNQACDLLGCFQDKQVDSFRDRERDEDDAEDDFDGEASANSKKPLNRAQQRQKDEMRSKAVAYRAREKAPPSPSKPKTSTYSFGAPIPPPSPKKAKKPASIQADPGAVRRQLKRASELSAPRHPPVDTALLKQEQKRNSRSTFDPNMSVAERLLLAQEQSQRRSSSAVSKYSSSSKRQGKRASSSATTTKDGMQPTGTGGSENQQEPESIAPRPASPRNFSPTKEVVAFRIEPLSSIRRQDVLEFRVEPSRQSPISPAAKLQAQQATGSPRSPRSVAPPTKEGEFLRSLAVGDFLSHAAEELSTALTALNVLLSMCDKELSDRNKLHGYRASLEALGILDEEESHTLFEKTRAFGYHSQEGECAEAFERLGLAKRCMRQLLEKLQDHEPGSAVIRAFCRSMRSVELRSVLSDYGEPSPDARIQEHTGGEVSEVRDTVNQPQPSPNSVTLRLFGSPQRDSSPNVDCGGKTEPPMALHIEESHEVGEEDHGLGGDIDLDFLKTTTSSFHTETTASENPFDKVVTNGVDQEELSTVDDAKDRDNALREAASSFEAALLETASTGLEEETAAASYPVTSDITFDIQMESDTGVVDADSTKSQAEFDLSAEEHGAADAVGDPYQDSTAEESLVGASTDDDWLNGGEVSETAEGDDLASNLQSEDATVNWEETPKQVEHANDTLEGGGNGFTVDEAGNEAEQYESQVDEPFGTADADAWQEEGELESNELLAEDAEETQLNQDEGVEPTEEFEEPVAAFEDPTASYDESGAAMFAETEEADPEAENASLETEDTIAEAEDAYGEAEDAYVETDPEVTEYTEDAELAEQELVTGEDADDEEAEAFGDWEKGFDPSTNHYFWFNHSTGESSWEPPEGWPYEVDEPFEVEEEGGGDEGPTLEDGDEGAGEQPVVVEGQEEAGHVDDLATRASEVESTHVSEFEFDDNDLPTF